MTSRQSRYRPMPLNYVTRAILLGLIPSLAVILGGCGSTCEITARVGKVDRSCQTEEPVSAECCRAAQQSAQLNKPLVAVDTCSESEFQAAAKAVITCSIAEGT
eukprot:TRINITY_DN114131_c0_g1_i1.p1 TRINITY_DN114131_c0_g1~~TRINITY_DN114131_c0_g1_i1.p1  ORF type:complete len:104 (-),score=0.74 TRINITY_DN114131_c0_g1_i1:110-421(-)